MPAIVVNVGSMLAGRHEGARLGACTDCRRLWAAYRAGSLDGPNLDRAHDQLMPTSGTCMVMGTASTMACMAETLGFMLPGTATAPAVSSDRCALCRSDRQARRRDGEGRRPAAERNPHQGGAAQRLGGAAGDLRLDQRARASRRHRRPRRHHLRPRRSSTAVGRDVPVLLDLKPAGSNFMEDFHAGGGLPALWRRLKDHLDLIAPRPSTARRIGDVIARWPAYVDDEVIRPLDKPLVKSEAIAILTGNLAPQGAAIKLAAATPELFQHEGPALVFDSLDDLEKRIDDPDLNVTPQTVMVLRNAGPIGAPGMPEAGALPIPKKLGSKGLKDMVRHLRRAHERHRVRHRGAARVAGSRGRRAARAGARRRLDPARRQGPQARPQGRRRRARASARRSGSRRRSPSAAITRLYVDA